MIPSQPRIPDPSTGTTSAAGSARPVDMVGVDAPMPSPELLALHQQEVTRVAALNTDASIGGSFSTGLWESPIGKALMNMGQQKYPGQSVPSPQFLQNRMADMEFQQGIKFSEDARGAILGSESEQEAVERMQTHAQHAKDLQNLKNNTPAFMAGVMAGDPLTVGTVGVGTAALVGKTVLRGAEAAELAATLQAASTSLDVGVATGSRAVNSALGAVVNVASQEVLRVAAGSQGYGVSPEDRMLDAIMGSFVGALTPVKVTKGIVHADEAAIPAIKQALATDTSDLIKEANSIGIPKKVLSPQAQFAEARKTGEAMREAILKRGSIGVSAGDDALRETGVVFDKGVEAFDASVAGIRKAAGNGNLVIGESAKALPAEWAQFASKLAGEFSSDLKVFLSAEKLGSANAGTALMLTKDTVHITLQPGADLATASRAISHELGHALVYRHLDDLPEESLAALYKDFTASLKLPAGDSGLGVADAVQVARDLPAMVKRGPSAMDVAYAGRHAPGTESASFRSMFPHAEEGTELSYWKNFHEYSAQQFVRYVQDAVHSGGDSAVLRALPEGMRNAVEKILGTFRRVFESLHLSGALKPAESFKTWFDDMAKDAAAVRNPLNNVPTVVDDVEELRAASKSASTLPTTKGTPAPAGGATATDTASVVVVPKVREVSELPPIPPRGVLDVHAKASGWSDKIFGAGWTSLWDKLQSYGGKTARLGNALVSNGMGSTATSAAQFKRTAALQLEMRWAGIEDAVVQDIGMNKATRVLRAKEFRGKLNQRMGDLYELLQRKATAHAKGETIPVSSDAQLEKYAKLYHDSGFAEKALEYLQVAERTGADLVERNPWYMPVRHDAAQFNELIRSGKANVQDIKNLYTAQAAQMFPDADAAWHTRVGNGLFDSIRDRASGRSADSLHFEGLTREDIEDGMLRAGLDPQLVEEMLGRYTAAGREVSKDKHLKRRMEWDWDLAVPTSTGGVLRMSDVVTKDVSHAMGQYIQAVSGQHGLGMVGIRNNNDLRSLIQESVQELMDAGAHPDNQKAARLSLENVGHALLGRPVGEAVPKLMQGMNTLAGALVLRNSGVYNAGEAAHAVYVFGASKVAATIAKSKVFDGLAGVKDVTTLTTLEEVLRGSNIADGRWRAVVSRSEDGHYLPAGVLDGVNQIGQGTKFFNGLEATRRIISNTVISTAVGELKLAVKGNAESIGVLKKYGLTDELLQQIGEQMQKHGDHPGKWDIKTAVLAENMIQNVADQINQAQRIGEIPEFMQTSVLGKVVMPYTTFVAGAYNKVLRKAAMDGGMAELGGKFLVGIAAGVLIEGGKNALAGRAPHDSGEGNFALRSIGNSPMSSWYGTGADLLSGKSSMRLQLQAGPAAMLNLYNNPSPVTVAKAVPLVAVTPIPGILSAISEE